MSKKAKQESFDSELAGLFDRLCELTEHLVPEDHEHFVCVSCSKDPKFVGKSGTPHYQVWIECVSRNTWEPEYTMLRHGALPYEDSTLFGALHGAIESFEEERYQRQLEAERDRLSFDCQAMGYGQ